MAKQAGKTDREAQSTLRKDRLKAALKENLRRRKSQARARKKKETSSEV